MGNRHRYDSFLQTNTKKFPGGVFFLSYGFVYPVSSTDFVLSIYNHVSLFCYLHYTKENGCAVVVVLLRVLIKVFLFEMK